MKRLLSWVWPGKASSQKRPWVIWGVLLVYYVARGPCEVRGLSGISSGSLTAVSTRTERVWRCLYGLLKVRTKNVCLIFWSTLVSDCVWSSGRFDVLLFFFFSYSLKLYSGRRNFVDWRIYAICYMVGKRLVYNPCAVPTSELSCVPPWCLCFSSIWICVLLVGFFGYGNGEGLIIFVLISPIHGRICQVVNVVGRTYIL